MRIISGKLKGRVVTMPLGIRPTQNKTRKALFDILGDVEGFSFLELFAGSGAVGFEAISRGVADLTLVEYNPACLLAIRKNIQSLKPKSCNLYARDVSHAIENFYKEKKKFDVIFLDPPYYRPGGHGLASYGQSHKDISKKILQMLGAYDILSPNGFIVAQHFKKDILPDRIDNLTMLRQAKYGDTVLSFYRK